MLPLSTLADLQRSYSRRWFMKECGLGLGSVALASMLGEAQGAVPGVNPQAPKAPPFPAKAKNVIFLFMGGAPSHIDLFDNKPVLREMDGKNPPREQAARLEVRVQTLRPKRHGDGGDPAAHRVPC